MKNVVLNYTEMEAKVHEATSADPWGASSTLMLEIAQGTYNYQYFNEIMPTIYKRFTEKDAKQWRQIYKALVLLEYLIKNGSERVVDDARSHSSVIKIMRNFYYIDEKGKDEGINIRNRAQEIVDLLSNTDKIRTERKLAKKNRSKYTGVSSEANRYASGSGGMGSGGSSGGGGSRYFGFGSESSNGLSFNGDAMTIGTPYAAQRGRYDDDDEDNAYGGFQDNNSDSNDSPRDKRHSFADEPKENTDNDDDWGDFTWGGAGEDAKPKANTSGNILDDDFADFQQADSFTSNTTTAPTKPTNNNDLFDLLGESSALPVSPALQFQPTPQPMSPLSQSSQQPQQPQQQQKAPESPKQAESQAALNTGMWAQASNFVSLDGLGKNSNTNQPKMGPSMNSLKNTSVANDWNKWATNNNNNNNNSNNVATPPKTNNAFDDLLSL
ncbi:ENTH-domain-containing protein [Backusella circina FSU 941]|nr:ENTH-domain-containing protein [Backusella circina FSU 941]